MLIFNKPKKYKMNIDLAGKALSGVYNACDVRPGVLSFTKAVLRNRQNYVADHILTIITAIILVATFLCPLFFPHSSFVVSSVGNRYAKTLSVTSLEVNESYFSFTFDGPVVDSGSSYMEDADGHIYYPVEYNRIDNTLVLPVEHTSEFNIFIYDINGKCLHLLLSPRE